MGRRRKRRKGPNGLETKVATLAPKAQPVFFTGNGKLWIYLPLLSKRKNPDFIFPGPDSSRPLVGVTKVIEAFGDYYHSEKFTGIPEKEHERNLVLAYAAVGIKCLVIWGSQVQNNPSAVRQRIRRFAKRES